MALETLPLSPAGLLPRSSSVCRQPGREAPVAPILRMERRRNARTTPAAGEAPRRHAPRCSRSRKRRSTSTGPDDDCGVGPPDRACRRESRLYPVDVLPAGGGGGGGDETHFLDSPAEQVYPGGTGRWHPAFSLTDCQPLAAVLSGAPSCRSRPACARRSGARPPFWQWSRARSRRSRPNATASWRRAVSGAAPEDDGGRQAVSGAAPAGDGGKRAKSGAAPLR